MTKRLKRSHRKTVYWLKQVGKWRESGLSQAEYSR